MNRIQSSHFRAFSMSSSIKVLKVLLIMMLTVVTVSSCGSGGGGSSFFGAGTIFISVEPNKIDVGDRTQLRIEIFEVNEDGVLVKIRFPDALSYVENTSFLRVDGEDIDEGPDVNVRGDNNNRFLVFFFRASELGDNREGVLTLELQGDDAANDGEIEVDIDVDDPDIDNSVEFNPSDPQFQAEDRDRIEVES